VVQGLIKLPVHGSLEFVDNHLEEKPNGVTEDDEVEIEISDPMRTRPSMLMSQEEKDDETIRAIENKPQEPDTQRPVETQKEGDQSAAQTEPEPRDVEIPPERNRQQPEAFFVPVSPPRTRLRTGAGERRNYGPARKTPKTTLMLFFMCIITLSMTSVQAIPPLFAIEDVMKMFAPHQPAVYIIDKMIKQKRIEEQMKEIIQKNREYIQTAVELMNKDHGLQLVTMEIKKIASINNNISQFSHTEFMELMNISSCNILWDHEIESNNEMIKYKILAKAAKRVTNFIISNSTEYSELELTCGEVQESSRSKRSLNTQLMTYNSIKASRVNMASSAEGKTINLCPVVMSVLLMMNKWKWIAMICILIKTTQADMNVTAVHKDIFIENLGKAEVIALYHRMKFRTNLNFTKDAEELLQHAHRFEYTCKHKMLENFPSLLGDCNSLAMMVNEDVKLIIDLINSSFTHGSTSRARRSAKPEFVVQSEKWDQWLGETVDVLLATSPIALDEDKAHKLSKDINDKNIEDKLEIPRAATENAAKAIAEAIRNKKDIVDFSSVDQYKVYQKINMGSQIALHRQRREPLTALFLTLAGSTVASLIAMKAIFASLGTLIFTFLSTLVTLKVVAIVSFALAVGGLTYSVYSYRRHNQLIHDMNHVNSQVQLQLEHLYDVTGNISNNIVLVEEQVMNADSNHHTRSQLKSDIMATKAQLDQLISHKKRIYESVTVMQPVEELKKYMSSPEMKNLKVPETSIHEIFDKNTAEMSIDSESHLVVVTFNIPLVERRNYTRYAVSIKPQLGREQKIFLPDSATAYVAVNEKRHIICVSQQSGSFMKQCVNPYDCLRTIMASLGAKEDCGEKTSHLPAKFLILGVNKTLFVNPGREATIKCHEQSFTTYDPLSIISKCDMPFKENLRNKRDIEVQIRDASQTIFDTTSDWKVITKINMTELTKRIEENKKELHSQMITATHTGNMDWVTWTMLWTTLIVVVAAVTRCVQAKCQKKQGRWITEEEINLGNINDTLPMAPKEHTV
jgi:hypothetical protein